MLSLPPPPPASGDAPAPPPPVAPLPRGAIPGSSRPDLGTTIGLCAASVAAVLLGMQVAYVAAVAPDAAKPVAEDSVAAEAMARATLFAGSTNAPEPSGDSAPEGTGKIIRKPYNWAVLSTAKAVSGVSRVLGIESEGRTPSADEAKFLHGIFGNSLDTTKIRINEGSPGFVTVPKGGAATVGHTIYFSKEAQPVSKFRHYLAHEATHVWQYQNGGADLISANDRHGYDLGAGIKANKAWSALNREQQATLVEVVVRSQELGIPAAELISARFPDTGKTPAQLTAYVSTALAQLRAGTGAP